ncbi:DNA damage checkpoint control protein [Yarrowia sp. B02]|nr:DNA damage checkpoint control protein [Yarrowia sp. B02]
MSTLLFSGTTTCVAHLYTILRAIALMSKHVTLEIMSDGFKFTVDVDSRSSQAVVLVKKNLFSIYNFNGEVAEGGDDEPAFFQPYRLSLSSLTTCLEMFGKNDVVSDKGGNEDRRVDPSGASQTCRVLYSGPDYPLKFIFRNDQFTTSCEFANQDTDRQSESLNLDPSEVVLKVILSAHLLTQALRDLEGAKSQYVRIIAQTRAVPHFRFESTGEFGRNVIAYPNERSVLDTFVIDDPDQDPSGNVLVQSGYLFGELVKCREAVSVSEKVCLRMDTYGRLSVQSMCIVDEARKTFVDFRFNALEEY